MKIVCSGARMPALIRRAALIATVGIGLVLAPAAGVLAQRKLKKSFAAKPDVRLVLKNWYGGIEVQGCECREIKVEATIDNRSTRLNPEMVDGVLIVDLSRDNPGTGDPGYVKLTLKVPYSSSVDIETKIGDIAVTDINGADVRAHVSSEGDIRLLNIGARLVIAQNTSGPIFFDGEIQKGGIYRFQSMAGDITIRIPSYSSFRLEAAAPATRSIQLGGFQNSKLKPMGGGRKWVGDVGDGGNEATMNVVNFRGSISFLPR